MRISGGSTDVCSSVLGDAAVGHHNDKTPRSEMLQERFVLFVSRIDRKSVVSGKSVSLRVDLDGRRTNTKNNSARQHPVTQSLHVNIFIQKLSISLPTNHYLEITYRLIYLDILP